MNKYNIVGIIAIVIGIIDFIYYIFIRIKGVTFAAFFLLTSIILIGAGVTACFCLDINELKKLCLRLELLKYVFFILVLSFLIIEGIIVYCGTIRDSAKPDYIIILGAGVRGTTPSLTLYERLKAGLTCISDNPEALVILSGGKGPGEDISEAEAMRRYFLGHGINEKRLMLEDESRDTRQNILFSKSKIQTRNHSEEVKVLLVTSNFHMFRSGFLAKRAGLNVSYYSASIPTWLIPTYYIREYFAVVKSYLFDKSL